MNSYRDTIRIRAQLEAEKMHGQLIKSSAKVLIIAAVLVTLGAAGLPR